MQVLMFGFLEQGRVLGRTRTAVYSKSIPALVSIREKFLSSMLHMKMTQSIFWTCPVRSPLHENER